VIDRHARILIEVHEIDLLALHNARERRTFAGGIDVNFPIVGEHLKFLATPAGFRSGSGWRWTITPRGPCARAILAHSRTALCGARWSS